MFCYITHLFILSSLLMRHHVYRGILLLIGMCLLPLAVSAQAVYKIISRASSAHMGERMVLEIGGWAPTRLDPGCLAYQFYDLGARGNQEWLIEKVDEDVSANISYFRIVNRGSGQVLETNGSNPGSLASQQHYNVNLSQNYNQQWEVIPLVNATPVYFKFRNRASNQFLDVGSTASQGPAHYVMQWTAGTSTSQEWELQDVTPNKTVYTLTNVASFKQAQIQMNIPDAGAPAVQGTYHTEVTNVGHAYQQWNMELIRVNALGQEIYRLVNRNSRLVLEVGNTDENAPIIQATSTGNSNQEWAMTVLSQSTNPLVQFVRFTNIYSGKVLSLEHEQMLNDGDPLVQTTYTNASLKHQTWKREEVRVNNTTVANRGTASALPSFISPKQKVLTPTFTLYPNPAKAVLSLSFSAESGEPTSVTVTDVRGGHTSARYLGHGQVDVASLPPGLYMVTVTIGQQQCRQKFVRE